MQRKHKLLLRLPIEDRLTLRFMKKNKWRTIVTLLGAVLCVAMISAVSIITPSTLASFQKTVEQESGRYHAAASFSDKKKAQQFSADERIEEAVLLEEAAFQSEEDGANFLMMSAEYPALSKLMPSFELQKGNWPSSPKEAVVTYWYGQDKKLGDMLNVKTDEQTYTFRISGILKEISGGGEGILLLPHSELKEEGKTVFFRLKSTADFDEQLDALSSAYQLSENAITRNYPYLNIIGVYREGIYLAVYLSAGLVAFLILIAGVSLIYNAFAISLNERTRSLAMLSSVGATKKQLRNSVLFEAVLLAVIAIPIGYVCGIGGITLTFAVVNPLLQLWQDARMSELQVILSFPMLLFTLLYSFLLLICSAWIPLRGMYKKTVMEALRPYASLSIKKKRKKRYALLQRLTGKEGVLGGIYLDRSRYRYRFTLSSLIICLTLFLVTLSFTQMMKDSFSTLLSTSNADVEFTMYSEHSLGVQEELLERIAQGEHVTKSYSDIHISDLRLSEREALSEQQRLDYEGSDPYDLPRVDLYALRHEDFQSYCRQLGLNEKQMDKAGVLLVNEAMAPSGQSSYEKIRWLKEGEQQLDVFYLLELTEDGKEIRSDYQLPILAYVKEAPQYLDPIGTADSFRVITCEEQLAALGFARSQLGTFSSAVNLYLYSDDASALQEDLLQQKKQLSEEEEGITSYIENHRLAKESQEAKKLILSIFLYGFLTLLVLVCGANIFHTLYTGIQMRKRELAMLKSCGLSRRGMKKMLYSECLLYGIRSCLYAVALSFLLTKVMTYLFCMGYWTELSLSWQGAALGCFSLFVLLFATMSFAIRHTDFSDLMELVKRESA